jgi:D-alanyl-D-alanine carboxypeptidase/D-alanyl-D-alanine-endopeptidase (penicillin-binding protein 4)
MRKNSILSLTILISLLLFACASAKRGSGSGTLSALFEKEAIFSDHYGGFALYDPATKQSIYQYQADKFFTPASNTKILTLYAALNSLGDSIPSVKYKIDDDKVFVWAMGDPTTLNPIFGEQDQIFTFLNGLDLPLIFCKDHFQSSRFGSGWAWDDFPYYYQTEKTYFPVFGNVQTIIQQKNTGTLFNYPNVLNIELKTGSAFKVDRAENNNQFLVTRSENTLLDYSKETPLVMDDSFYHLVFSKLLKSQFTIASSCPEINQKKIFYSTPSDTVFSYMMQTSDNFIAEHLLMASEAMRTDTLNTESAIKEIKEQALVDIASALLWYDGSGLSRYNMFTPNALVTVLDLIRNRIGDQRIKKIFPGGGVSGTIKNWYQGENNKPYVYAKTGTLRAVHCLSGYIYTDSGKTLIFSFMHNNFKGSSSPIKEKMNRILQYIKANY